MPSFHRAFSASSKGAWLVLFCLLTCTLSAAPLRIVTLNSVLAEFASTIGGPDATVECLIPGGSDPHGFSPSPADLKRLVQADLVIASGFGMEPWLDKLVSAKGLQGALLDVSTAVRNPVCSVEEEHLSTEGSRASSASGAAQAQVDQGRTGGAKAPHDHPASEVAQLSTGPVRHEHGELDPHWWHSVPAAREVCRAILRRCVEADVAHRTAFQARWEQLDARLAVLETWVQTEVSRLPVSRRHLVTSHDAFGYFARDCQFQVHPLTGVNPEAEPDARALVALIQFIRREQVRSVFADNTENPRLLAAMLKESGATLGGTLYADGPGAPDSPASNYEAMIRHNTRTIIESLLPKP